MPHTPSQTLSQTDAKTPQPAASSDRTALRIVSYNIQAAIGAHAPTHYLTRVHRQFLHTPAKDRILERVGHTIEPFDIACLQEIDLGGRRAGFRSQVADLFRHTSFTDAAFQENRKVGSISRHGNLILTRREMDQVHDVTLPAKLGGRGALVGCFPVGDGRHLTVANLHLSLGEEDQRVQLERLADELWGHDHIVVCGDFNMGRAASPLRRFMKALDLRHPGQGRGTYPSWKPRQALDHALVSRHLAVEGYGPIPARHSDHLPIGLTVVMG